MKTIEMKQERARLVNDARVLSNRASAESRDMNAEERSQVGRLMNAVDTVEVAGSRRIVSVGQSRNANEYRKAFAHWAMTGEFRDVLLSTNSSGGYLAAPVEMAQEIVQSIANLVAVRQLATKVEVTNAAALRIPKVVTKLSAAEWSGEDNCNTADTSLAFGNVDLTPTLLAKLVKISWAMMTQSNSVESVINQQLTQQFAYAEENAFLNGSGSGQPLGVFTPSADGVPTSQDVLTGTPGVLRADDLISARFALKQPYLTSPSARWIMNRSVVSQVRLLKDNFGQYLWQPGIAGNHPDNILDIPVVISEFAPGVITSGAYVAILGDFSYYTIADYKGGFGIQRLVERFSECNEVGIIARRFVNGAPTNGESFARVKVS